MEETKKEDKKNKEESRPHFVKVVEYNEQPWLTDIIIGQRGSQSHGHLTASGATIWYLRDEQGKEIIKNGSKVD